MLFQSHHDSIINQRGIVTSVPSSRVSIPPWFDYKRCCRIYCKKRLHVSIPPWFDYKPLHCADAQKTFCGFQSHHDSIINQLQSAQCFALLLQFQSHHDSIINFYFHLWQDAYDGVSIPPWFDYKPILFSFLEQRTSVSIPPWFDYKPLNCKPSLRNNPCFNPTMIRL